MIESKYKILITCILIYLYKYQICLFLTITFIELGNSVLPIFDFSHFSIFFELLEKKKCQTVKLSIFKYNIITKSVLAICYNR